VKDRVLADPVDRHLHCERRCRFLREQRLAIASVKDVNVLDWRWPLDTETAVRPKPLDAERRQLWRVTTYTTDASAKPKRVHVKRRVLSLKYRLLADPVDRHLYCERRCRFPREQRLSTVSVKDAIVLDWRRPPDTETAVRPKPLDAERRQLWHVTTCTTDASARPKRVHVKRRVLSLKYRLLADPVSTFSL